MADPITNLSEVTADKRHVWDPETKTHVNLLSIIIGLALATLNALQALAAAVGNDRNLSSNSAGASGATGEHSH